MKALKSISYFVAISITAGAFNYLFQVIGARSLSIEDFSKFNEWFAYTSMFAFAGGLLQNAANFYLIPHKQMVRHTLGCLLLTAIGGIAIFASNDFIPGLFTGIFIIFASMNGWLTGQAQIRLMYKTMAFAGLALATIKVMMAGIPLWAPNTESFIRIVTLAFIPSILLLAIHLFKSDRGQKIQLQHTSHQVIMAAIAISLTTALVPQLDILVLSKTQPKAIFEAFVQASIFYKVVFFFFLIFAQWLLPQQTLDQGLSAIRKLYTFLPILLGLLAATILTVLSEPVSVYIMNWNPAPPKSYVFLSCINMSLLTWLFLLIQESCAKKLAHKALVIAGLLALLGLGQYIGGWSIYIYFAVNATVTFLLILVLLQFLKIANNNSPR